MIESSWWPSVAAGTSTPAVQHQYGLITFRGGLAVHFGGQTLQEDRFRHDLENAASR
jgi:hypothetical protein